MMSEAEKKRLIERAAETPHSVGYSWKVAFAVKALGGTADSEHFYIVGDASVEMVDGEGDIITVAALQSGLEQLLRRGRISFAPPGMGHTDILVGEILDEVTVNGQVYRTEVRDGALKFVGDVWKDSNACRHVREGILEGTYDSLSISGEALSRNQFCDDKGCYTTINQMDLSAVAICEEGMNPAAKFTLLKAAKATDQKETTDKGGPTIDEKVEKKDAPVESAVEQKPELKAVEPIVETPETKVPEVAKEEPKPEAKVEAKADVPADKPQDAPPEQAPPQGGEPANADEATIQAVLKNMAAKVDSLTQSVATLTAQVAAIQQGKGGAAAPEAQKAAEPAIEKKTEMPEPLPKKTLVKEAGGSQCAAPKRAAWEQFGEKVKKAGGFTKIASTELEKKKREVR